MRKTLEMDLEFLPYLNEAPVQPAQLQKQAVSNDETTIQAWKETWIKNAQVNHKNAGTFLDSHLGTQFGRFRNQPAIVLGSGPSLKNSIEALKQNETIPVISCLHNFHYLVDNDIKVDLWVTLDRDRDWETKTIAG